MGVFNLSIFLSMCAAVALGQAQGNAKKDDADPSKVLTITDANWIK